MNNVYQGRLGLTSRTPVVLVLACGAQLMVVLDGLVVSVALPEMRSGLALTPTAQQWIVDAYLLTLGGLLLLAARAADLLGHRRLFRDGLLVFTVASLLGGLAPNGPTLIAARAVQGVGAAALATCSLSLLTLRYTGTHRPRALAIWSATSGCAGAFGLVLGGVITSELGWRWVLLINVPIGLVLWLASGAALPRDAAVVGGRLDITGAVLASGGIGVFTYAIASAEELGWASLRTVVLLALAAVFGIGFLAVERRAPAALVPLAVLRRRNVAVANIAVALLGAVMTATLVFLSLYLQRGLGWSALRTGLGLLPMSLVLAAAAFAARSLMRSLGAVSLIGIGAPIMVLSLCWLADLPLRSSYPTHVLAPTLCWAAGAGIMTMPCVALATSDLDAAHAGLGAGLVNTARQVGGAVGLAALTTIASSASAASDASLALTRTVEGYRVALFGAAGVAALITFCAAAARPRRRRATAQRGTTPAGR